MDKGVSTVVAALIGAAATIIVGVIGPYGLLRRENSQLQSENASLQEENTALQEQTPDTENSDWSEQVSGLQSQIAALQSQIEKLGNDKAGLQSENERLTQENERLKQDSAANVSVEPALPPGESFDLLSVCPPYETYNYDAPDKLSVMGTKYKNAFWFGSKYAHEAYAFFNVNGQYSLMEFDVGHVDGSDMRKKLLTVYLNGEAQDPITLYPDMMLTHYSFSISGISQVRLEMYYTDSSPNDGAYTQYGFVNAKLYA